MEKAAKTSYKGWSKLKSNKTIAIRLELILEIEPKSGVDYFNLNDTNSSQNRNTFFVTGYLSTEPNDQSDSSLAIDRLDGTLSRPFFVNDRAMGNQTTRHLYPRSEEALSKSGIKLDSRLTSQFPHRKQQDFVKQHAKGFKDSHNGDLFQHVFRILLRNQHLLTSKKSFPTLPTESTSLKITLMTSRDTKESESDLEYAPIEAKEFMIDQNIDRFTVLDKLATLYEETHKIKLTDYFEEVKYEDPNKVSEEFERENFLIEHILNKINNEGLNSLNLTDMIAFKCK